MPRPVDLVRPMDMLLGEGPVWLAASGELGFVDIKGMQVHRLDVEANRLHTVTTTAPPTFLLPEVNGDLLVGSQSAICRLGPSGLGETVAEIDQPATNRTNDATVDCHGRLWFGTMDDREEEPSGAIWCLDRGQLRLTSIRAAITNGPAVSQDGSLLYYADSAERTIWRCAILSGGELSEPTLFARLRQEDGYPDGVVLDSAGCLWVGLWDGWAVLRYSPEGELMERVPFPCARVTKVAFGGADLCTVYATTARIGLDDQALERQPLAGSVFAFRVETPGVLVPRAVLAD